jgi:hypothetical protein
MIAALVFGFPVAILEMAVSDSTRMPVWYGYVFSPGDKFALLIDNWLPPQGPGLFPGFARDMDISIGTNWVLYAVLFWVVFTLTARSHRKSLAGEVVSGLK